MTKRVLTGLLPLLAGSLTVAGCQTTEAAPAASASAAPPSSEQHAFVQAACGGCHSVEPHGLSPNPDAPEFPRIANQRGLTAETLATWLRDAHNYPVEMDFYLEDDEIDDLVAYLLTLRREDYQPPI